MDFAAFIWIVLALFAAICSAGILLTCQNFKTGGQYLVIWSRLMILTISLPILFFIPAPEDWRFYLAVGATGIIAGLADAKVWTVTNTFGGGIVSRIMPLQIFIIFIMWLFVHPELIFEYLNSPFHTLGILGALTGCVYFASHLRYCDVSSTAMKKVILPLLGYAVNFVLAKYAFDISDFHGGVYYYILVQSSVLLPMMFFMGLASNNKNLRLKKTEFFKKTNLVAAAFVFLFWLLHMIFKNYAITLTFNPSYVAALVMTTPAWIIVYYKAIGYKEDANVKAGIGLMVSAIILSLLNIK